MMGEHRQCCMTSFESQTDRLKEDVKFVATGQCVPFFTTNQSLEEAGGSSYLQKKIESGVG